MGKQTEEGWESKQTRERKKRKISFKEDWEKKRKISFKEDWEKIGISFEAGSDKFSRLQQKQFSSKLRDRP